MHILFTKEEIDKSTIINLSKKYRITHCPILISKKKNYSNIEFDKFEYLILTSSNSLKFLDFSEPLKKLQCYCVGDQTAKIAQNIGFKKVIFWGGNYNSLKNIFFNSVEKKKNLYLKKGRIYFS